MTQPAGWYDDPQDPNQLRYWDGIIWSTHTSPKISPAVEQSTIGMPYGVTPAAARPQSPGSQGAQGPSAVQDLPGAPGQAQGQPGGGWPAYGQGPGQLGQGGQGWQLQPPTTPDGVPLSGWWKRVAAWMLDSILTFFLALPLTAYFWYHYVDGAVKWADDLAAKSASGVTPVFATPPWEIYQYVFAAAIIQLLITGAYEVLFLSRSGATPGMKVVGISVRLRDQAGPPPMRATLIRTGLFLGMRLINIAFLLDVLWPLWDDKKQAIHDKAAATNVVVGKQPKPKA
jgi:uncharacterized RDD family membrane protein YckC